MRLPVTNADAGAIKAGFDAGLSYHEIGRKIGRSSGTVGSYVKRMGWVRERTPKNSAIQKDNSGMRSYKQVKKYFCRGCRQWVTWAPCVECGATCAKAMGKEESNPRSA
jgi:hypothetical protein